MRLASRILSTSWQPRLDRRTTPYPILQRLLGELTASDPPASRNGPILAPVRVSFRLAANQHIMAFARLFDANLASRMFSGAMRYDQGAGHSATTRPSRCHTSRPAVVQRSACPPLLCRGALRRLIEGAALSASPRGRLVPAFGVPLVAHLEPHEDAEWAESSASPVLPGDSTISQRALFSVCSCACPTPSPSSRRRLLSRRRRVHAPASGLSLVSSIT
jgi:hypothetical protein